MRRSGHIAAITRFLGAVLVVSGLLLIADVALTLTWKEPLTALRTDRAQGRVADEVAALEAPTARDARATRAMADPRKRVAALARRARQRARQGRGIGRIELPTLGRSYAIVHGTRSGDLRKGPGHYPSTRFPGEGRTVAIAGHRTTYGAPFRTIDALKRGDRIIVAMPYARLTYRVRRTRIVLPSEVSVLREVGAEQLVLSACEPLYSAEKRIIVFARLEGVAPTDVRPT